MANQAYYQHHFQYIIGLQQQIQLRDQHIQVIQQQLQLRDQHIQGIQAQLNIKEQANNQLQAEQRKKDATIVKLRQKLAKSRQETKDRSFSKQRLCYSALTRQGRYLRRHQMKRVLDTIFEDSSVDTTCVTISFEVTNQKTFSLQVKGVPQAAQLTEAEQKLESTHKILRVKDKYRISYKALQALRIQAGLQIPTTKYLNTESLRLGTSFEITPIQGVPDGGMRQISEMVSYLMDLPENRPLLNTEEDIITIWLHFASDGAKITKCKDSVRAVCKLIPPIEHGRYTRKSSPDDEITLLLYMGKEDRTTFETASRRIIREMKEAATHGYQVKGKTVKVAWLLCSDWKAMALLKGLNAANSSHFCLWCHCHKHDIANFTKDCDVQRTSQRQEECLQPNAAESLGYKESDLLPFIPYHRMIPDELHLRMRITNKLINQSFTLRQVVEEYSLPVEVRFADPHVHFDSDSNHSRSLVTLTIIKVHYETYFLANTIANGEALDEVIPIPLYLKEVTFCPIIGVRGRDIDDGGKAMMDRLLCRQSLARVDFNRDHSDKEMVQLSKKPLKATDNIYANIETNIYINVREKVRGGGRGEGGGRRQPPPPPPPEMPLHDQPAMAGATARESEYENRDTLKKAIGNPRAEEKGPQLPPRPGKSVPKTSKNPQPARSDIYDDIYELCMGEGDTDSDDGVYEPVDDIRTQPMLTTKSTKKKKEKAHPTKSKSPAPGPAALTSELADTLQKMKTRIENGGKRPPPKEPQRTPVKKPDEDESTKNTLPFQVKLRPVGVENNPKPSTPPSEEKAAILALKSSKTAGGNSTPTTPTAGKPEKGAKPVLTPKPEPPAKHPKHTGVDPSTGKTSPGKIPAVPQVPKPEPKTPKTSATQIKSSGVPPTKITQSLQVSATKTSAKSDYVNQKEMAIVGPTTRQKTPPSPDKSQSSPPKTSSPQPALQKQGSTQRAKLKPLQKMSISDVQALLPRLNMSKYQTKFEELQVDGLLLSKLDDQALKEDFEMSRTDMIKLKNFISEGHLPCYEDWHVK